MDQSNRTRGHCFTLCLNKSGKYFSQTVPGLKVYRGSEDFGLIPADRFHPISERTISVSKPWVTGHSLLGKDAGTHCCILTLPLPSALGVLLLENWLDVSLNWA